MKTTLQKDIEAVRSFNRYYTNKLGLLNRHILESDFSFSETRILLEISLTEECTAKRLSEILCMDPGYISRILKQFEEKGLIQKERSTEDSRSYFLRLTEKGKAQIADLSERANRQIARMIEHLPADKRETLVRNMLSAERILEGDEKIRQEDISIRCNIESGDIGYLIYMHGWIYQKEYGYSPMFEAYVAKTFYEFMEQYHPEHDRLWIVEHNGEIVGCVGVVGRGSRAQFRWFLLHPDYRGVGLGKKLMQSALDFCRQKKFDSVYLETTNDLETALSLYTRVGFKKVSEKENNIWRTGLTELAFEMKL